METAIGTPMSASNAVNMSMILPPMIHRHVNISRNKMDITYDPSVCEHCFNNPKNNPNASGICCCSLPYISRTVPYQASTSTDYQTGGSFINTNITNVYMT